MEESRKWLQLIIGIAAFVVLYLLWNKTDRDKAEMLQYWEREGFKTDTVHVAVDYEKLPKPTFSYSVPPAKVYTYNNPQVNHISVNLNDSLISVIDSLENTITSIHTAYLKLYPSASKFIYGSFTIDSMNLDLLSIDGKIRSHSYPWDLKRFKYQWVEGALRASKVDAPKDIIYDIWGSAGYDISFKAPVVGVDASLYRDHWRLRGNSFMTLRSKPEFSLNATIGYKIR